MLRNIRERSAHPFRVRSAHTALGETHECAQFIVPVFYSADIHTHTHTAERSIAGIRVVLGVNARVCVCLCGTGPRPCHTCSCS